MSMPSEKTLAARMPGHDLPVGERASSFAFVGLLAVALSTACFLLTGCGDFPAEDAAPRPAAGQPPGDGFSVMTWNLEWFYDEMTGDNFSPLAKEKAAPSRAAWDWHRDAVAASIAQARPTVVAVQEVENRRVLWYLTRSLERNHSLKYREHAIEGRDHFTEQDVGFLVRWPAEVVSIRQFTLPQRLLESDRFGNVSKHVMIEVDVAIDDLVERIAIMNVHFRAGADTTVERTRQARSIRRWLRDSVIAGDHVIVLGDMNTEETSDRESTPGSDLFVLAGKETESPDDDLVDLHSMIPAAERDTHLLRGKQFDRIFVTRSLAAGPDAASGTLTVDSVTVRRDLSIRGKRDSQEDHWERFWDLPENERDLSDHYPVLATFSLR